MKIKKLEIHNLASIRDAVIDFEKAPLAEAELFLITGTTGSGKTTILDAISLALYNTTPRIAKGQTGKAEANDDNLTGKDSRNIMRQNTGYAYSRLWFEGNDDRNYLAEWSVERGTRRNPTARLSNETWSVTELGTGKCTCGKKTDEYKEVATVILEAVGLDFNQFCRTTMLAQGEFTEFLKSDESAKAEILEKISGTDIYRKIGMEIHDQYILIKKRLEDEQGRHDNIVTLPEEERQALESELAAIDATIAELAAKADSLQKCIGWLEGEESMKEKVDKAEEDFKKVDELISSEEFIRRKKTVEQWKETVEVREALSNAGRHKANAYNAADRLTRLEKDFRDAVAGESYESDRLKAALHGLEETEKVIEAHAQNVSVYKSAQTIIADVASWESEGNTIEKATNELKKKEETDLPAADAALKEAAARLTADIKAEEDSRKLVDEANELLAALNLSGLRNEKEFLTGIKTVKENVDNYRQEIAETTESMTLKESQLKDLKAKEAAENAELSRLKEEHKRRELTIETLAKEMRAILHAGLGKADNICPVCGQVVSELKADALLDEEYQRIKKEFADQEAKAKEATGAANSLESLLKVTRESLDGLKAKHDKEVKKLTSSLEGRSDAQTLNDSPTETIAAMITSLQVKISEGEKIEQKKEELAKMHTACVNKKGEAANVHTKLEAAVEHVKTEINALKKKIAESEKRKETLKIKIDGILEGSLPWDSIWYDDTEAFAAELKHKESEYNEAVGEAGRLAVSVGQIRPVLEFIANVKEEIMTAMPKWSTDGIAPMMKTGLQNFWTTLKSKVNTEINTVRTESASHKEYTLKVDKFISEHPEYSIGDIESLMTISSAAHINEDTYVSGKVTGHMSAAEACKRVKEDLAKHFEKRPESIKEEDTPDSLKEAKTSVEALRDERNTRKGELQTRIEADDEAIRKKGDTTVLDQLKEEYEHWNSFHKLFGDANGDKLSRTAQSYVLESLLANANRHLRNMAPRYRLLVNPGTLNLKLEDQYNDYQTRSTNSISGGESFLVSLALALALADFGQHLGVSMLFIDEGFGTLSGEALTSAINTLKSLHTDSGRQVGIISHREEIRDSIPVQIKVNLAPGTSASTVEVSE